MPLDNVTVGQVIDVPGAHGLRRAVVISVDPYPEYVGIAVAVDVLRARFGLPKLGGS